MRRSARRLLSGLATGILALLAGCGADSSSRTVPTAPQPIREPAAPVTPTVADAGVELDAAAPQADATDSTATADVADAAKNAPPPKPRIASVSHYTWIYKNASRRQQPIGYVRPGTSVPLRSTEPVSGSGCSSGRWLPVEPAGYVCNDGATTLDLDSDLYRALEQVVRPRDHVLPYRYGYSTGAPMYGRIPDGEEIAKSERVFGSVGDLPRDGKPRTGYEELATYEVLKGRDPLPPFATPELPRMRGYGTGVVRKNIPAGSLLSFSRAVEADDRTYLLSTDLTWVPADRIRPFRESAFQGVHLGGDLQLPIAWTRSAARKQYRKLPEGGFEPTGSTWPPRTMLRLTGEQQTHKGRVYLETRQQGLFIRADDASVVEAGRRPSMVKDGEKWIEFSASKGTFTLYVGDEPVFSTLASPGRGGGATSSRTSVDELVDRSQTPLGIYRVTFKTFATTMTPEGTPNPKKHWIQDVPYTQYFRRPFAIHTAYWHEDFGMPKSGGCINLSPLDARFVFGWTDPALPDAWSGVSSSNEMGLGTTVVLRR